MAKYCNVCRQSYSVEYESCPFCEVPARLDRSRTREGALADAKPQSTGPRSSARLLLGQSEPSNDTGDADIDLGSPSLSAKGADAGPPSGASFISWTALINARKDFDDDRSADSAPASPGPGPSARSLLDASRPNEAQPAPTVGARPSSIWFYVGAVMIGVVLAILVQLMR
jgi:hypothetical protein